MVKFSYIVPTVLKCADKFYQQLYTLRKSDFISEIIIINNSDTSLYTEEEKTKIIKPEIPSFCNGAWNIGVEHSTNDYIILATDDILYDISLIEYIASNIGTIPNLGLIGMDYNLSTQEYNKDYVLDLSNTYIQQAGTQREYGFGFIMFLKRINYTPIPYQIRHWYGDDYLYYTMLEKNLNNFILRSDSFRIKTEAGSMSGSYETKNRIEQDREFWMNNYYEKFSKYGTRCG